MFALVVCCLSFCLWSFGFFRLSAVSSAGSSILTPILQNCFVRAESAAGQKEEPLKLAKNDMRMLGTGIPHMISHGMVSSFLNNKNGGKPATGV
jgi:hypothetical protein